MNIALLATGELFGGAERQVLSLLRYMHRRSTKAALMAFHDGALAEQARQSGIETVVLDARAPMSFRALRDLRRELVNRKIQVLHVHGYKAAVYGALAQWGLPVATVRTEHGLIESSGRGIARLRPKLYRLLEEMAGRITHTTHAYVTRDLYQRLQSKHSGGRGVVIYNGIDLREISVSDIPPPEFEPSYLNLVIAGRLDAVKGIEVAIDAMANERMPVNAKLHIVGSGPLLSDLEKLAAQRKVKDRIKFLGFRADVYSLISHADALLMPSLHEGLPYTLLEAMALRTPILASSVGGISEVMQNGRTALLFPHSEPAAIATAVTSLALKPSLAEQLVNNAFADVKARFSLEGMGEQYLRLYRQASAHAATLRP